LTSPNCSPDSSLGRSASLGMTAGAAVDEPPQPDSKKEPDSAPPDSRKRRREKEVLMMSPVVELIGSVGRLCDRFVNSQSCALAIILNAKQNGATTGTDS